MRNVIIIMNVLILTILCLPRISYSQTGPGGVGTTDGTSALELWLKADVGVTTSGTTVTAWADQSGNSDVTTVEGDPSLTGSFNASGYDAIHLDGDDSFKSRVSQNTGDKASVYVAASITGYAGSYSGRWAGIISASTGTAQDYNSTGAACFLIRRDNTDDVVAYRNGSQKGIISNGLAGSASSVKILNSEYDGSNNTLRLDGTASISYASTGNFNFNDISIGRRIPADRYANGYYAEVIYFSTALNKAQKIIIENYLQAKYDGTLASSVDLYDEDDAANGDFDYDVAGIGRIDASNQHTDAQGIGIVRILNPSNLNNNEFLFWGHDNGVLNAIESSDVPSPVVQRFDRVWRVSEVNTSGTAVDVGSIDIRFDLTGLGSVTASDLRLLVDTDNDGVFADETPISGATSIGSNVYQFTGVTAIANNLRFTLGTINNVQTPLPIELISFEAKVSDEEVVLYWQTATETNNDYFTIERSANAQNWEPIAQIKGAGNSNDLQTYTAVDKNPINGINYYRLKQTDYDGAYSYSSIQKVRLASEKKISLYPNPTKNTILIEGLKYSDAQMRIYNMLGQEVGQEVPKSQNQDANLILDLSSLPTGVYFIRIGEQSFKVFKQ